MAVHLTHRPWRTAAVVVTVGVFTLTGCGADDTPVGGAAAPATASPATSPAAPAESPVDPEATTTMSGTAARESATAEPSAPAETGSSTPAAAGEPARELVITIADFAYEVPETVPPGATITVVNGDSEAHTVTSGGDFNVNVTAGESITFTAPEAPGEYRIICLLHGNMTATLVVASP